MANNNPEHDPARGLDEPVFPPEIFEITIDILAARPSTVTITQDQISALKACSLVSRLFLALARVHLFRLVDIGLGTTSELQRLDRLVNLLGVQPSIKSAIQQLSIQLENYRWRDFPQGDLERRADALVSLSAVKSVAVCYSRGSGERGRISTKDHIGSFCTRILEAHAAKGTLQTLLVKKMSEVPYTTLFLCSSLTTLSLDRCQKFPNLTAPIPTIRSLTLRKMDFLVSTLSYFPNLETLRIIRVDIKACKSSEMASLPAPSFGIRTLALEQCSQYGGADAFITSISTFINYFYEKAEKQGLRPFKQLATLGVILYKYSEFSVVAPLLKDVSGTLQTFSFGVFPPSRVSVINMFKHLRDSNVDVSFRYQSTQNLNFANNINITVTTLFPIITSFYPSFLLDRICKHPEMIQAVGDNNEPTVIENAGRSLAMKSWITYISSLRDTCSGFLSLREVEIYLMVGDVPNFPKSGQEVTDETVNNIVRGDGVFVGAALDDFDGTQWSKARIIFHLETDI